MNALPGKSAASKTVPNTLDELPALAEWLTDWMVQEQVNESAAYQLRLVMEELASNAVNYGFPTGSGGQLTIHVSADPNEPLYRLIVEDDGMPFNPIEQSPEVDTGSGLDDMDIGGLGLFLVQNVSEELTYERKDDKNVLSVSIRK